MSENQPPSAAGAGGAGAAAAAAAASTSGAAANGGTGVDVPAGMPFYEKSRQRLKELLARRRALEKQLGVHEEVIYSKETEYLETTLQGNIITGFDNYTKGGASSAAAQRRKIGQTEANRVFSRSSISYNANAVCGPWDVLHG